MDKQFSGGITVFHGLRLPEKAVPAGYAAIIDAYKLSVPLPYRLSCIGQSHRMKIEGCWRYFTPRYAPQASLKGHLLFALKYEGIDLAVLKFLFSQVKSIEIKSIIQETPTGSYVRRIWFLYEWLMGKKLSLPDLNQGNYVSVIDPRMQYAVTGVKARRQRVVDNLPGNKRFCPLVFKTEKLEQFLRMNLKQKAADVITKIPTDVMGRTAAFLLLKDSKASYAIENEIPVHKRIERWGKIIGQAGVNHLDMEELVRLQKIVIGDTRFVEPGVRKEGGFIGEHDRETGAPLPEHISAKNEDLTDLLHGLIDHSSVCRNDMDPVIDAAALAFGFVYIHPFSDGNGRLHRYLIHHVLAQSGFNPPGLVFPVSAVMLEQIDEYRNVLVSYSSRLLPYIEWEKTEDNNVTVTNDTADYYRYFDATPHAEFLYHCVERTIKHDLPEEAAFRQRYDRFRRGVEEIIEMPSKIVDLLFRFLSQNEGRLSKRGKEREFKKLTKEEADRIEDLFKMVMR